MMSHYRLQQQSYGQAPPDPRYRYLLERRGRVEEGPSRSNGKRSVSQSTASSTANSTSFNTSPSSSTVCTSRSSSSLGLDDDDVKERKRKNADTDDEECPGPSFPPRPQATAPPRHLRKPWWVLVEAGCVSEDYAHRLVECTTWDDDELDALVNLLIWRGVGIDDEHDDQSLGCIDGVSAFARLVRDAFPNPKTREKFVQRLRDVVVETFLGSWHRDSRNRKSISYSLKSPNRTPSHLKHILYSIRLCSFIGDLFFHGLLSRNDTVGCVRVLFYNMDMVEHLCCVEAILGSAGVRLWRDGVSNHEARDFQIQLETIVSGRVQDHKYLLPQALRCRFGPRHENDGVHGAVRRKVDGLIKFVYDSVRW